MNQHLRIPLDPLIELLIRRRRLLDRALTRHNEAQVGSARDDHVAQVEAIVLDVVLTRADGESLLSSAIPHTTPPSPPFPAESTHPKNGI